MSPESIQRPSRFVATEWAIFVGMTQCKKMEAVIFIGVQASGKSSFYKERYFLTHVRISLDLLKTRNRERRFLTACLDTQQAFVIDNTNPSRDDRAKYIDVAKTARYSIVGYYFQSRVEDCLERNERRTEPVPEVGILSTARKLQLPSMDEGFDNLKYVRLTESGFLVEAWNNDL